ncbi:hypothetical protein [Paraburkholderia saeva]|nr:hypothetical protein [Paraburkholderia saeva]CAG4898727.1 hypothetical protein R52603_02500 [Paraburkholderia saeva]
MNIDFYWVLFFVVLLGFITTGFALSALFPADHPGRHSRTGRRESRR